MSATCSEREVGRGDRAFYETELRPLLAEFEARRAAIRGKLLLVGGILLALVAAVALLVRGQAALIAVFLAFAVGTWVWSALTRGFVYEFKQAVIGKVVTFCRPGLEYFSGGQITEHTFRQSELFQQGIDRYRGEDLMRGRIGETDIRFSEVHAEHKTETRDSKGRRHTRWHTIFKGLFVVADFNKHFQGSTVVLPDVAESFLGSFGKMLQDMNLARAELVKLEDPDFEKAFVVYADDQVEARYILSPKLMRRILSFRSKTGTDVYLAFVRSTVYVALKMNRDMWEPRIMRNLLDIDLVEAYVQDVELAAGIVEDLDLNTRIWTKD